MTHDGHRERLKKRFLSSPDSFEDHELLELILFYSIPRKDTNEIAHDLLNHFGSLKGVFDADFSELIKIKGIKENSATLIKLIPQISRAYLLDKVSDDNLYDRADKIGEYLTSLYVGETVETVYILLLDNSYHLLNTVKLIEGNVNSAVITPKKIFVNPFFFMFFHSFLYEIKNR